MTSNSLSHPDFAINPSHDDFAHLNEHLLGQLTKASAMVKVALSDGFFEQPRSVVFDYLSLLDDTLNQALEIEHTLLQY